MSPVCTLHLIVECIAPSPSIPNTKAMSCPVSSIGANTATPNRLAIHVIVGCATYGVRAHPRRRSIRGQGATLIQKQLGLGFLAMFTAACIFAAVYHGLVEFALPLDQASGSPH